MVLARTYKRSLRFRWTYRQYTQVPFGTRNCTVSVNSGGSYLVSTICLNIPTIEE